jgi:GxxExxY protein
LTDRGFFYKNLTYEAIGAAMEVHTVLGSGLVESVYETALAHELDLRGISYRRQADLRVQYKGIVTGEFRADFLVDDAVVVELKAVKQLTKVHKPQVLNYLKATGYRVGLLFNFGSPSLEYKRRAL